MTDIIMQIITPLLAAVGATLGAALVAIAIKGIKWINSKQDLVELEFTAEQKATVEALAMKAASLAEEKIEGAIATAIKHTTDDDDDPIAAKILDDIRVPSNVMNAVVAHLGIDTPDKALKKMSVAAMDLISEAGILPDVAVKEIASVLPGMFGLGAINKPPGTEGK